jgi:hypothetical protein
MSLAKPYLTLLNKEIERQRIRETERKRDKEIERQRIRETERKRERDTKR